MLRFGFRRRHLEKQSDQKLVGKWGKATFGKPTGAASAQTARGWTRADVAHKAGRYAGWLHAIFRQQCRPTVKTLAALAQVPVSELWPGE